MTVDQHRRGLRAGVQPIGVNDRVQRGVEDLDVFHTYSLQVIGGPAGGAPHLGFALFVIARGNGGDAQKGLQAVEKLGMVFLSIGQGSGQMFTHRVFFS